MKTIREIEAKKTNYIFTFGSYGSGKSTILATMSSYLTTNYKAILNRRYGGVGIDLVKTMVEKIESGKFPEATPVGSITEFDIAVTVNDDIIDLTFIEMSGEYLKGLISSGGGNTIKEEIEKYLNADISISFFLVADYESIRDKNMNIFFVEFLSFLHEGGTDMSKVALIVSQMDKCTKKIDMESFVSSRLGGVKKFLEDEVRHGGSAEVFPFSVGTVKNISQGQPKIEKLDLEDCGKIVSWLKNNFKSTEESKGSIRTFIEKIFK